MSSTSLQHASHDALAPRHHDHGHIIEYTPQQRLRINRLGLWLFIISEVFLFSGILVARIVLLRDDEGFTRPELDQKLGLLITSILLASSFAVNFGEVAITYGKQRIFEISYAVAILMGIIFVGGVGYEWTVAAHFTADEHVEGGMFFFMTGMHALHVITGILFLIVVFFNGRRGLYNKENHWAVEASAIYWHFVDVVWVFFYVGLYLVGHVPEVTRILG